jgi:hypothetical protein
MKLTRGALMIVLLLSGCVGQGVPNWAMHVQSERYDPDASTDKVAERLGREMTLATLPIGHLAPEQIAAVAIREIEQDHQVDGALWLAMASYRYHQEAFLAMTAGDAGLRNLPPNVRRSAYIQLVDAEIERFTSLGFFRELRKLEARAYGQNEIEQALQQQLTTLGKTSEIERESLRDALWQMQPAPAVTSSPTRYLPLADAFRKRLLSDARRESQDENPAEYLARTPIPLLQADALDVAVGYFEPSVCVGLAAGFPALRSTVVAHLFAAGAWARANAAATLGLAPSPETRGALEARLAVETDPHVKLAIAYALVHHGVAEQAIAITSALQVCQKKECTLPVMLAHWLPKATKIEIDAALPARIARGPEFEPRAHMFAAALLGAIGRAKPLDEAAVEALVVASRRRTHFEDKMVAAPAYDAIGEATVLTREAVLARIGGKPGRSFDQDQLSPGPLLARLAAVSEAEDLPLLGRMMARYGKEDGPEAAEVVKAAFHIPGDAARNKLITWMVTYPNVRPMIVVGLASTDYPPDRLERLVAGTDGRAILLVKILQKSPDLMTALGSYLRTGTPADKLAAAELTGLAPLTDAPDGLVALLYFHDTRYYPNDAVLRHAAIQSLVRLALVRTVKPTPASPAS